ncbi:zinc-ribbon and DUF3426 domain-containing protein [Piscinibacter sakaiensis]|uniref:zinc-ribbon and DUF3426 domain-containing protein n=1 Tax=Piscinibacter sakaiensis TaxID=1547922 RepID=UPI003AAD9AF7
MSLATRCSACGTIFRVVDDQLKVSDGWVRCGRCDTVFDALDGMVDLDDRQQPAGQTADRAGSDELDSDHGFSAEPDPIDTHQLLLREAEEDHRSASDPLPAVTDDPPPRPLDLDLDDAEAAALAAGRPAFEPPAAGPAPTDALPIIADQPEPSASGKALASAAWPAPTPAAASRPPSFMRRADREAKWSSPAMRAALIGSSLILVLMLLLQVVYHERDAIAARSPLAGDWLRSACARWDCRIDAPRKIRDVTIDNSALTKLADRADAARLSLTMRNRSNDTLAMPAVELSLTDFEGRLIARKALLPSDFRIEPPVLAANSDLPVQIVVSAGERRIAGYTVELFYP